MQSIWMRLCISFVCHSCRMPDAGDCRNADDRYQMDGHFQFAARLQSAFQPVGDEQQQDLPCRRGEQFRYVFD